MISVVLNCDTRPQRDEASGMFNGACSMDFLVEGVINKSKFFEDFDIEVILFIDEHVPVPDDVLAKIRPMVDKLVLSKHSKHYRGSDPFGPFNDVNYLHALSLARGSYVAHFDQDVAAYAKSADAVYDLVLELENHNFVSLPSVCSPDPVQDESFGGKWWTSTRFFMCKREALDITALEHAIREPQWAYETFGRPPREHPWTEHLMPLIAGYKTFYPPVDFSKLAIFPWSRYKQGTLEKLNAMPYEQVAVAVQRAGGAGALYDGLDATLMNLP